MPKIKVMCGMSGGVDSSVSAVLLMESGYEVSGATLELCNKEFFADKGDAKAVCEALGISHYTFDFTEEFKKNVIDNFIDEYIIGRTPNPCIVCNKKIKFSKMLQEAEKLGMDKIATGHYAQIIEKDGRYLLKKAADQSKDQTYVLYCLNQEQLSKTLFPLGRLTKGEVRACAEQNGFINADKPDSQDICFVPDGDYASFIENCTGVKSEKGYYVNQNGEILGEHKGVIRYTIGQRKGLGIALGKPAFVIDKNPELNTVTLGEEEALFYKKIFVEDLNFIPFDELTAEMRVTAKLRYRHKEQPAKIYPANGGVVLEFDEPQRAPSPGQSAVFYDGDYVVGGGIIVRGIE